MAVSQPGPVGDLCTACGMCCNGALFDDVPLNPHEVAGMRAAGSAIVPSGDGPGLAFAQPCRCWNSAGCGIYASRPERCRTYFCRLARRLDAGEIESRAAHDLVARSREQQATIAQASRPDEDHREARDRWRAMQGQFAPDSPDSRLHAAMITLNLLLDRHFRDIDGPLFRP